MNQELQRAVQERRVVSFSYEGQERVVQPHAYGEGSNGPLLRAYQTGGYSSTGNLPQWRLYKVDQMRQLTVGEQTFEIQAGYRRGDSVMRSFYAQADD